MATNRFLFKDKIGCRPTRASNAETQLLGYIAWQWDRYLVPQNVFLVFQREQQIPPHSSSCKPRRLCFCFSQISFWQKLWRL